MTKSEFIKYYARHLGISQKAARQQVDAFVLTLSKTVEAGEEINFTGLGKFFIDMDQKPAQRFQFKSSPALSKKLSS